MKNLTNLAEDGAKKTAPEASTTPMAESNKQDIGDAGTPSEQPKARTPELEQGADIPPWETPNPESTGNTAAIEADKQPKPDIMQQEPIVTPEHSSAHDEGLKLTNITFIKGAKEAKPTPKPPDKAEPDAGDKFPDKPTRRGKQTETEKFDKASDADKPEKPKKNTRAPRLTKGPIDDKREVGDGISGSSIGKEASSKLAALEQPPQPREAPLPNGTDQIVYLNLSALQPFKNHPFGVRDDAEMKALVESIKTTGINQPAIVRPMEDGGYEIIAGHRRQKASELAGYSEMPCIVRNMTDDEAMSRCISRTGNAMT